MEYSKFSFQGIKNLCDIHFHKIMNRTNLKAALDNRRVRFINPLGSFDYAFFGDFYFKGDVMMLITKDIKYTRFHQPDQLSKTLWSTVPVIFAGVDTGYKDDNHQEIFTGDVVSYRCYTSFVRYFWESNIPGLAGDNCEILFENDGDMHKEGTVFSNISIKLFEEYDIQSLYWPIGVFCYNGLTRDEVIERSSQALEKPIFYDGDFKTKSRGRRHIYNNISEVYKKGDIICLFVKKKYEKEGKILVDMYADNCPVKLKGELHMWEFSSSFDLLKVFINDFLLNAHNNPDKTYIICDFKKSLRLNEQGERNFAMLFWDWYEYNIPNVILPVWIFADIVSFVSIGRN